MAIDDPYAQTTDYFSVFPNTQNDNESELDSQLRAVSRHIERTTGMFFTKDAAAVTRIYVVRYAGSVLHTDDIAVTPTALAYDSAGNGGFATTVTGYELRRNGSINPHRGPEPKPWNEIYLPSYAVGATSVSVGQRWRVTAQFGWPAVPEAVRQATIQITALLRVESPRATASIDQLGQVVSMNPQARSIVDDLIRAYREPVFA